MKPYSSTNDTLSFDTLTIGVWGLGKMGLPLAAVLADSGANVRGVDISSDVVDAINEGQSPIENEPKLDELVSKHAGDRLTATTDGKAAATAADVMILLVPTVVNDDHEPILDPVLDAANDVAAGIDDGDLVILESTVPPGTTNTVLREELETTGKTAGVNFGLSFCPERTSSGRVIQDLTESYPKIVGGVDSESTAAAAALYRQFNEPGVIEVASTMEAEAVKVFEGVYRDVNIALANELAKVCHEWNISARDIFAAANTQPYCELHDPGVGVGGHCIPVYPYFVIDRAKETPLLETARGVNDSMPTYTVERAKMGLENQGRSLTDARVLVLGLTYRPGVAELRYSPAVDVVELLNKAGADVLAHDPLVDSARISDLGATPVNDPMSVSGVDAVVLATGHQSYNHLDLESLRESMTSTVLVDGRDFFDRDTLSDFDSFTIGGARSQR